MDKIFIAIDSQKKNIHESNLQALSDSLKQANETISELIGVKLDIEIAFNIINNGYKHFVDEQVKIEELKLKASNFSKLTITNICTDLRESLTSGLETALSDTSSFNPNEYLRYLVFHKNGNPYILETAQKEIIEQCSIYADTPEKIKLYKKHQEAVKVLNDLKVSSLSVFGNQLNAFNFFNTLFVFDKNDNILQKEINYNLSK